MSLRTIRPITFFLALGFSLLVGGQALAEEDSPDELNRRIGELSNQGKGKEAIPLAEKLDALTEQTRGRDDATTAANVSHLALLYQKAGEYASEGQFYVPAATTQSMIPKK